MQRQKSDEIDVAAIGDLLRRGEGSSYRPLSGLFLQLQQLDRYRFSQGKTQSRLKNQVIGHLDRIFPGLILSDKEARERYAPLFKTDFWQCQTLQNLIRICPNPHRLIPMTPEQLVTLFHEQGCRMGVQTATRILDYAQEILPPDPELAEIRSQFLQRDLALLDQTASYIIELEAVERALLSQTPYHIWATLKGLSSTLAASLAAALGPPENYQHAGQIVRRSGIVSSRHDSGLRQQRGKGRHVTKVGDVYLRRALINATYSLIPHQPVLNHYFHKLKQRKPNGVALVATARKTIHFLWAIQRDQYANSLIVKVP